MVEQINSKRNMEFNKICKIRVAEMLFFFCATKGHTICFKFETRGQTLKGF